jgi:hypothetical protein
VFHSGFPALENLPADPAAIQQRVAGVHNLNPIIAVFRLIFQSLGLKVDHLKKEIKSRTQQIGIDHILFSFQIIEFITVYE